MPAKKLTAEEELAKAERDRRIIELRRTDMHWRDIAKEVGLSMGMCHRIWKSYVTDIPQSVASEWREQELDLLGTGIRKLLEIANDPAVAHRTRVEARKEIRFHSESRRKITGIDSPVKREIELWDMSSDEASIRAEVAELEAEAKMAEAIRRDVEANG